MNLPSSAAILSINLYDSGSHGGGSLVVESISWYKSENVSLHDNAIPNKNNKEKIIIYVHHVHDDDHHHDINTIKWKTWNGLSKDIFQYFLSI